MKKIIFVLLTLLNTGAMALEVSDLPTYISKETIRPIRHTCNYCYEYPTTWTSGFYLKDPELSRLIGLSRPWRMPWNPYLPHRREYLVWIPSNGQSVDQAQTDLARIAHNHFDHLPVLWSLGVPHRTIEMGTKNPSYSPEPPAAERYICREVEEQEVRMTIPNHLSSASDYIFTATRHQVISEWEFKDGTCNR